MPAATINNDDRLKHGRPRALTFQMRQIQRHRETYFQLSGAFGIVEGRTSERDTPGNLRNVSLGNSMSTTPALATLGYSWTVGAGFSFL